MFARTAALASKRYTRSFSTALPLRSMTSPLMTKKTSFIPSSPSPSSSSFSSSSSSVLTSERTRSHSMPRQVWSQESRRSLSLFNFGEFPTARFPRDESDEVFEPFESPIDLSALNSIEVRHDLGSLETLYPKVDAVIAMEHVSQLWPVLKVEQIMMYVHESVGLPWWGTICLSTILLRTLLMPYTIYLLRNSMRMKKILPELEALNKVMKTGIDQSGILSRFSSSSSSSQATPVIASSSAVVIAADQTVTGQDPVVENKEVASLKNKVAAAHVHHKLLKDTECHPLNNFIVPMLFPPLVLSVFGAVHNLSIAEPSMTTGGALWFKDLVASDPTFVLPTMSGLMWLWVVECAAGVHYFAWSNVRTSSRCIALAFIPVTSTLPSGIFIFWITSNIYAIAQTYILRFDGVRRFLRIPLASEIKYVEILPKDSSEV
eukprot:TRINITY_DN2771_c0_g1_i3.p1 TRINITY_DN2771_c0_g1~~TRINITY_DN2771_c0_g1_i3.p1  ORF type:complete len:433 (-),score=140.68 TRINITY_DN2771_c0_g1_i3:124-1422(-)